MDKNLEQSCAGCIWAGECCGDEPCDFFDNGRSGADLYTDAEIEENSALAREEYEREYLKYVEEYGDGRNFK